MRQHAHLNFEELLFEAVDEGLSSIGESAKQAIYYYLENGSHIQKQDIPYKVDDFAAAIEEIFGSGADFLEIIVLKQLYGKIGKSHALPSTSNMHFVACIEQARKLVTREQENLRVSP